MWNFRRLFTEVTKDRETCLKWLEQEGILPTTRYCSEGHEMKWNPSKTTYGEFRCRKIHIYKKDVKISRAIGTWFENVHVSPEKALTLTMCFLINMNLDGAVNESSDFTETSSSSTARYTVVSWYQYCREIITEYVLRNISQTNNFPKLGGTGNVIDVYECRIDKRRFSVGVITEGMYIIGFINRETNELHLDVCDESEKNPAGLAELVKKHVAPGSTVVTNRGQGSSNCLPVVVDSQNLIKKPTKVLPPTKPEINLGYVVKNYFSSSRPQCDRITEYVWRKTIKLSSADPFHSFLDVLRSIYPVNRS